MVYREGEELKHPKTGEVLGRTEKTIGLEDAAFEALESDAHFDHVLFDAQQFGLHAAIEWQAQEFERRGCETRWVDGDLAGMGKALRAWDPFGYPLEFFHEM